MDVHVVDHPLAAVRLTALRDAGTDRAGFRTALHELTLLLVYEATRTLAVTAVPVSTPLTGATGAAWVSEPLLVPLLRAGAGMLGAAQTLLPGAAVGFIGVARDEQTLTPQPYLATLPDDLTGTPVLLLDPMLATGGSAVHAVGMLAARGATDIAVLCAVAAPAGVAALGAAAPGTRLFTAALDDGLDAAGYIVPGLGDAGDRLFGPR